MGTNQNRDRFYQVYRHFSCDNKLLYVGRSLSVVARLSGHKAESEWYGDITRIEIENFDTHQEMCMAEKAAIIDEMPMYNKVHNWSQYTERPRAAWGECYHLSREVDKIKKLADFVSTIVYPEEQDGKSQQIIDYVRSITGGGVNSLHYLFFLAENTILIENEAGAYNIGDPACDVPSGMTDYFVGANMDISGHFCNIMEELDATPVGYTEMSLEWSGEKYGGIPQRHRVYSLLSAVCYVINEYMVAVDIGYVPFPMSKGIPRHLEKWL